MGVLSGFLIASHYVAKQLSAFMTIALVGLYSIFYMLQFFAIYVLSLNATNLDVSLAHKAQDHDSEISTLYQTTMPPNVSEYVPYVLSAILLLCYVTSLAYFFHVRNSKKS